MFNLVFKVWVAAVLVLSVVGCSGGDAPPPLYKVQGTVTVDGKPGADLEVMFDPQGQGNVGSGSSARTDSAGHYELQYKGGGSSGAVAGKHVVRIEDMAGGGPAGGEAGAVASTPIPATYNTETNLSADVEKKDNTIDFQLTTTQ